MLGIFTNKVAYHRLACLDTLHNNRPRLASSLSADSLVKAVFSVIWNGDSGCKEEEIQGIEHAHLKRRKTGCGA